MIRTITTAVRQSTMEITAWFEVINNVALHYSYFSTCALHFIACKLRFYLA